MIEVGKGKNKNEEKKKKSKLRERERAREGRKIERRKHLESEGIENRRDERKQEENGRMTRKE
jgi:hypothetical protein